MSRGLALAFLAGPWTEADLVDRGGQALGQTPAWLPPLVRRLLEQFQVAPVDGQDRLAAVIAEDAGLRAAFRRRSAVDVDRWLIPEAAMVPVDGPPGGFSVVPLPSPGDVARALALTPSTLDWFADSRGLNARAEIEALVHYHYRWVPKASGGHRLLEAPKARLKRVQRWILRQVLAGIPAAASAHGFVPGRNVVTFALPHAGQHVVVRLDLEDFFASVSRARVAAIFRRVGYPKSVALVLACLCTAPTPARVLAAHPRDGADLAARFLCNQRLRDPHLPQGAPTSPALSNLAAFGLDRRVSALAAAFGATMTRYADDLAFAGNRAFARSLPFFLPRAAAIALEEGFRVNHRKTRVMRQGRRQQLCGLVVNQRPNLPRTETDRLRALLYNAVRFGPDSQNRDGHPAFRSHLEGRISWVTSVNPTRGRRLQALFDKIRWPSGHDGNTFPGGGVYGS